MKVLGENAQQLILQVHRSLQQSRGRRMPNPQRLDSDAAPAIFLKGAVADTRNGAVTSEWTPKGPAIPGNRVHWIEARLLPQKLLGGNRVERPRCFSTSLDAVEDVTPPHGQAYQQQGEARRHMVGPTSLAISRRPLGAGRLHGLDADKAP
ncbi:MAG: hypothetical protein JNK49_19760 [Planctomycetes bacterium]|nr:hypothetical protein [Planctomycetota bacterium]